ncbi:MAG TPA: EamA family transporter [Candidatus Limnocylindrales bacterium]|nr:EamA family transporter [Candidatus Limnocylindrales bacterium]
MAAARRPRLAMVLAAVLVAPAGVASWDAAVVTWAVVAAGAVVAVLSSVVPYSLEVIALRRLDMRVFGVLLSLEPAFAALAGLELLGQVLSPMEIGGIGLVVVASALVMREQTIEPAMEAAEIG